MPWPKGRPFTDEMRRKMSEARKGKNPHPHDSAFRAKLSAARKGKYTGPNHPSWRGGTRTQEGYTQIWTPDGYKYEHRMVMERVLGRPLASDEVVHHINENRADNRPENLQVMLKGQHTILHKPRLGTGKAAPS